MSRPGRDQKARTVGPLAVDQNQSRASDPAVSAWVSANAGTGKTYVLVQRVLGLLLAGTPPERILCLTFTKAAASEMSNRLFKRLGDWAVIGGEDLGRELSGLLGHPPSDKEKRAARRLFARTLETPGGLKVQTIHAFCERLLQRFPLEADIAPHFSVLEEERARQLKALGINQVLSRATDQAHPTLRRALEMIITYAGEGRFEALLGKVLQKRRLLEETLISVDSDPSPRCEALIERLKKSLGIDSKTDRKSLTEEMAASVADDDIAEYVPILLEGKATDQRLAEKLSAAAAAKTLEGKAGFLNEAFLTEKKVMRSDRFITNDIREKYEPLYQTLLEAKAYFYDLTQQWAGLILAESTAALIEISDAVMQEYTVLKTAHSALDFNDLIVKTKRLLSTSEAAQWVLYKLDGGIDHILVDEAQDTNPEAWAVIQSLAEEFFSGHGIREKCQRTIFAVGDEKQSIFGFQGADPDEFAHMGRHFSRRAEGAGQRLNAVPLNLSFRSTPAILQAVDLVFQSEPLRESVTTMSEPVSHYAFRQGQAGCVEIWQTETTEKREGRDPWCPLQDLEDDDPKPRLAARIADLIHYWLDRKIELKSEARPIRPGDILILVRKREPFAPAMLRALKSRKIPVAGADRMKMTNELAVMDLMVLGDFLLMPEDDLALAVVLKSPLFEFDDDQLLTLRTAGQGSLWEALRGLSHRGEEVFSTAYERLKYFLASADYMPPFEFYARLLSSNEQRKKFITRMGAEAGDAIDEFLNMAIKYEALAPPSLQGFLTWMRQADHQIKRDMEQERDEVRVMTVHGAKGLEANIVFMPDCCSAKSASVFSSILSITDDETPEHAPQELLIWGVPEAKSLPKLIAARDQKKLRERKEYYRLLYVAMTRARDALYICGFEHKKGREEGCWYDILNESLSPHMVEACDPRGYPVLRLTSEQDGQVEGIKDTISEDQRALDLPPWANRPAPHEPVRRIPLTPSTLFPESQWEESEEGQEGADDILTTPAVFSPFKLARGQHFLRGQLTHILLEHLPHFQPLEWQKAADHLIEIRAKSLSSEVRKEIVDETIAILNHPDFSALFGPGSLAEVGVSAEIYGADKTAPPILLSGKIDRLVVLEKEVLIIDYKTHRPTPREAEHVAPAYMAQLAAYRLAMRELFPEKSVRCALLWTDGPYMMPIPEVFLDHYEKNLSALIIETNSRGDLTRQGALLTLV